MPALIPATGSELPALVFVRLLCRSTLQHAAASLALKLLFLISLSAQGLGPVFFLKGWPFVLISIQHWMVRLLKNMFQGGFLFQKYLSFNCEQPERRQNGGQQISQMSLCPSLLFFFLLFCLKNKNVCFRFSKQAITDNLQWRVFNSTMSMEQQQRC